jgi:hypothetical protein
MLASEKEEWESLDFTWGLTEGAGRGTGGVQTRKSPLRGGWSGLSRSGKG